MAVPLFRLEEHHEAFFAWHYGVSREMISGFGNILLHVDEHSDWGVPRLRHPLEELGEDLEQIIRFTYEELDVGSFIWPAIYQGLFSEVIWMRHQHSTSAAPWRMFIRPVNDTRTKFVTGLDTGRDEHTVRMSQISSDDRLPDKGPLVLDIDLDYFYSHPYPDYSGCRLEITADAYNEFVTDRYHFLRIAPGSRISAVGENGKYYLLFNDFGDENRSECPAGALDQIGRRMVAFLAFLRASQISPQMILVCRSEKSGYTPASVCDYIERSLLQELSTIFEIEIHDVEELAPVANKLVKEPC